MSNLGQTLKWELFRNFGEGVSQALYQSLSLIVLVTAFAKTDFTHWYEAMISSAGFVGMMLAPFYVSLLAKGGFKKSTLIAWPTLVSGLLLIVIATGTTAASFAVLCFFAFVILPMRLPLVTSIYADNFPSDRRGKYSSYALMVAQSTTVAFYFFGGRWLEYQMDNYTWLFFIAALVVCLSSYSASKIPTEVHEKSATTNFLKSLSLIKEDRAFGLVLVVWFMFGFANLWIMPIRVNFLDEQLHLSAFEMSLVLGVIPEAARFVFTPVWGRIYDKVHFIKLRMLLNVFLLISIAMFFWSTTIVGVAVASILFGMGLSGGRLAWGIWVSKMAPKNRIAEYMAVHVFLTGLRGTVGPFIGFWVLGLLTGTAHAYQILAALSCALIGLSLVGLYQMLPNKRFSDSRF